MKVDRIHIAACRLHRAFWVSFSSYRRVIYAKYFWQFYHFAVRLNGLCSWLHILLFLPFIEDTSSYFLISTLLLMHILPLPTAQPRLRPHCRITAITLSLSYKWSCNSAIRFYLLMISVFYRWVVRCKTLVATWLVWRTRTCVVYL